VPNGKGIDQADEGRGAEPPEPWYYGFLEKYTLAMMWSGIIILTLPFLAFTVLMIGAGTWAVGSTSAGGGGRLGDFRRLPGVAHGRRDLRASRPVHRV
jgi:hypothetical protein